MRCIFSITRHQPRHPFSTLCCNFSITRDQPRHPLCRSVEAPTASQHVAAWIPRRSVAAPTASQRRSRVAASQRQQRCSVDPASQRRSRVAASQRGSVNSVAALLRLGSVAASQRRSATRPPERRSVAAPPAPWSVTAQRRKPTFRPPLPLPLCNQDFQYTHYKCDIFFIFSLFPARCTFPRLLRCVTPVASNFHAWMTFARSRVEVLEPGLWTRRACHHRCASWHHLLE